MVKKVKAKKAGKAKKKKAVEKVKKLEKIKKRLRDIDRELLKIEKELAVGLGESTLVTEDMEKARRKLLSMEVERKPEKPDVKRFYRNFVFKCKTCLGEFEGRVHVSTVKRKIVCPACGKNHAVGITQSSRFHHVDFPESLEVIKALSKREKKS